MFCHKAGYLVVGLIAYLVVRGLYIWTRWAMCRNEAHWDLPKPVDPEDRP